MLTFLDEGMFWVLGKPRTPAAWGVDCSDSIRVRYTEKVCASSRGSFCELVALQPASKKASCQPVVTVPLRFPLAAGDHGEDASFDLFSISNINRKTIGAKLFRGPDSGVPAYRFVRFDYIPPVNTDDLNRIVKLARRKEGFFLTAQLKQDRKSRGTLLVLEGPGTSQRQFEIVSNGPGDTLDLNYWVEGNQHTNFLEDVGLADSQWKNVTVQVASDTYSLYVGCDLIDSVTLEEPFYEQLEADRSRMYVAKGASRESHFRVRK